MVDGAAQAHLSVLHLFIVEKVGYLSRLTCCTISLRKVLPGVLRAANIDVLISDNRLNNYCVINLKARLFP